MKRMGELMLVVGLAVLPVAASAQAGKPAPPVTARNSAGSALLQPEALSKTVHETWVDSGRDEEKFFQVVKSMAEMSAMKRGVSLPDTEAAGQRMGNLIKASARRDPNQLLYAVVDAAVRQATGAPARTPAAKR